MNRMQKTIGVLAFLALALILAGCSTPTVIAPPTPDIPAIRTESVQTLVAKLTIEAALNPPTSVPTETPAPAEPTATATPLPSPTQAPVTAPTATLIPTVKPATSGGSGSVVYPTATRRSGPDQAEYISQKPADGTVFSPGTEFDGAWTFKNIGTKTWNSNYRIRVAEGKGTIISLAKAYYLKGDVAVGKTVTVYADMKAPSTAGRYVSYWELVNDNGDIFFTFYLVIDVK